MYWESYGLTDGDTVDTELQVERLDSPGVFQRIRVALGAAKELDGARTDGASPNKVRSFLNRLRQCAHTVEDPISRWQR